jgi:hypothetical protein
MADLCVPIVLAWPWVIVDHASWESRVRPQATLRRARSRSPVLSVPRAPDDSDAAGDHDDESRT